MSKPQFILFKMFGCGHCVAMVEKPTPQTSTWAKLSSDPELKSKVDFVLIEFGMSGGKRYPLPEKYKFVNYGPYLYLRPPQGATDADEKRNAANGVEFKSGSGYNRTTPDLKKWIIDTLAKKPALKVAGGKSSAPRQIPQTKKEIDRHALNAARPQLQVQSTHDERMAMREKRKAAQKGGHLAEASRGHPVAFPTKKNMPEKYNNFLQKQQPTPVSAPMQKPQVQVQTKSRKSVHKPLHQQVQAESKMEERPQPESYIVPPQQGLVLSEYNQTLKMKAEEKMQAELPRQRKIRYKARNRR